MKKITIVTDASRLDQGHSGWAAILKIEGQDQYMISGKEKTKNALHAELLAVVYALREFQSEPRAELTIIVDSQAVMNGFYQKHVENWKKENWLTSSKASIFKDLWLEIEAATVKHYVHWQWVSSYAGHPENYKVDEESRYQAKLMLKEETQKLEAKKNLSKAEELAKTKHCFQCKEENPKLYFIAGVLGTTDLTNRLENCALCETCFSSAIGFEPNHDARNLVSAARIQLEKAALLVEH